MESITRRSFLRQGATGATALGGVAALSRLPRLVSRTWRPAVHEKGVAAPSGSARDDTLVVHVPDPRSSEVRFLFGTREVIRHDRELVERLVKATH